MANAPPTVRLISRTAQHAIEGLRAAIDRVNAYLEAGVDAGTDRWRALEEKYMRSRD